MQAISEIPKNWTPLITIKELGQKGKNSFRTEDYYGHIHNFAQKSRKVIKSWTSFCHLPF